MKPVYSIYSRVLELTYFCEIYFASLRFLRKSKLVFSLNVLKRKKLITQTFCKNTIWNNSSIMEGLVAGDGPKIAVQSTGYLMTKTAYHAATGYSSRWTGDAQLTEQLIILLTEQLIILLTEQLIDLLTEQLIIFLTEQLIILLTEQLIVLLTEQLII